MKTSGVAGGAPGGEVAGGVAGVVRYWRGPQRDRTVALATTGRPGAQRGRKEQPRTIEDDTGGEDPCQKMLIQMRCKHALGDGGIDHARGANFDDLQGVDRDVLATAFYRSAFRLCDGHPQDTTRPAEDEDRRGHFSCTQSRPARRSLGHSATTVIWHCGSPGLPISAGSVAELGGASPRENAGAVAKMLRPYVDAGVFCGRLV